MRQGNYLSNKPNDKLYCKDCGCGSNFHLRYMGKTNKDYFHLNSNLTWKGSGYFHLLHEKIFMLGVARGILEKVPNSYIIVDGQHSIIFQFAHLLGVENHRLISLKENDQPILVKKIHVPYFMKCGHQSSELTRATRQWIRDRQSDLYSHKNDIEQMKQIVLLNRNSK